MKLVSGKKRMRILKRQGWQVQRIKGSHHHFTKLGRPGIVTVPVHGNKTLDPRTQRSIMKQAGLSDDDL